MRPFRRLLSAAAALALALYLALPPPRGWVERVYARGLYPRLAELAVPVTGALPLSLAAALALLVPLAWLVAVLALARARAWDRILWFTLGLAVVMAGWFVLAWGLNYRRQPVELQFGLVVRDDPGEAEALLAYLLAVLRREVGAARDEARAFAALRRSLQDLVAEASGVRPSLPARPKLLPPGLLIRWGGAAGVMSPWTLEPHLDGALSEEGRLAVGLHELAHVAGYAGEADADLLAALAGLRADDPYGRYAVALRVFADGLAQLPAGARASWLERLPPRAREDLRALQAPFARYAPPGWLLALQRRAFDRYLRSQRVTAGVADYGRAFALLAAAWRQGWLSPP